MSEARLFTEELEGLLREVAADPRSILLRAARPKSLRGLLERQEILRPSVSGLTRLDQHLLAVYRDELADLLMRACRLRLFSDESISLNVHRSKGVQEDWELESHGAWSEAVMDTARTVGDGRRDLEGCDLLIDCCRMERFEEVSITQLARAALRLKNSGQAHAWVAFDQRLRGRFTVAIKLVDQQLVGHVRPSMAASVLEYRASAKASLDDFAGAVLDARRAHLEDEGKASALVNWMHYAIMAGNCADTREAGRLLDSLVTVPAPGLSEQLEAFEGLRREGHTKFKESMRRIALELIDAAGPLAGKVLHVYL